MRQKVSITLFTNQSGMPAGATCHDDDAFSIEKLAAMVNECTECDAVMLNIDTSTHAVGQACWLLKDLLEHEVRVSTFLYLTQIYVDGLHLW